MDKIFPNININKYQEEEINIPLSSFEVFKKLYPHFENIFFLESLGEEGKFNRFSYIGFDPHFVVTAKGKTIIVGKKCYTVENPYHLLSFLNRYKSDGSNFCGGLVGFVSHESTKYFEPAFIGHKNYEFPDFEFGFYPDGLKFDKKRHRFIYFHHGQSRLGRIISLMHCPSHLNHFNFKKLPSNKGEREHKEMVKKALEHIKKGDIFQVVLSLKTSYRILGDTRRLYAILRQINPSPYMFFLKFKDRELIGASPELLIRVKGRIIEHFGTLAGTRKRGQDEKEDKLLQKALLADEKERAEHMMLVDLARNDVGKICEFGSVRIEKLLTVKKYSHVQHLYTEVRGELKDGKNSFAALSSCFPAGTLTGAPKIEAMKIINKLEGEPRGPYGGVVGYFSLNGESMFAIAIRSLFVNGEQAYTQTGSGIVFDSIPEKEYQEIVNKQKAMEVTLQKASL